MKPLGRSDNPDYWRKRIADGARAKPPVVAIMSGPPNPDLPFRYGCSCGAIWNASAPLEEDQKALCGPHCFPRLFRLEAA